MYIKNVFISAGQDPFQNCNKEFKKHLNNLSKLPAYEMKHINTNKPESGKLKHKRKCNES